MRILLIIPMLLLTTCNHLSHTDKITIESAAVDGVSAGIFDASVAALIVLLTQPKPDTVQPLDGGLQTPNEDWSK